MFNETETYLCQEEVSQLGRLIQVIVPCLTPRAVLAAVSGVAHYHQILYG